MNTVIDQPKRIMCVGMCVLDIIHVCENFPTEDTDRRCLAGYWQRGGNASNNCTVLRQLGAPCEFLGMLSASSAFGFLLDDCKKRQIMIENCPSTDQEPAFSSVILVKSSDTRTIIHSNSNFPILTAEHFLRGITDLSAYKWIHFEARNPEETLQMLKYIHDYNTSIEHTTESKVKVSIELEKIRTENLILTQMVDVIFLGKDLAQHLGWQNAQEAVYGLRTMLNERDGDGGAHSAKSDIICTWGSMGSSCLDTNDQYAHLKAIPPPTEIVDSLGAGDTFCAATIYAISMLQYDLKSAVDFGNRCAGYKLGHRGYDAIGEFQNKWQNI